MTPREWALLFILVCLILYMAVLQARLASLEKIYESVLRENYRLSMESYIANNKSPY